MADILKVLGQSAPAATTLTDLYTVPAVTSALVSSIIVCNRGATATTFRIAVAPAGAADATSQQLFYDATIEANDTFIATIGLALATTDKIRVYAGNTSLTFCAAGIEVT